jgi:hypothetical protein
MDATPLIVIETNTITAFLFADAPLLLSTFFERGLKNFVSSDDKSIPHAGYNCTSPFGDVFGEQT